MIKDILNDISNKNMYLSMHNVLALNVQGILYLTNIDIRESMVPIYAA